MRFLATLALLAVIGSAGAQPLPESCVQPKSGEEICLSATVFTTGKLACLAAEGADGCVGDARQTAMRALCSLRDEIGELDHEACFTRLGSTKQLCPKPGHYVVWRNVSNDIWIQWGGLPLKTPAPPTSEVERTLHGLENLKPMLIELFTGRVPDPTSAYAGVQITPVAIYYNGRQCLEPGHSLGTSADGTADGSPFGQLIAEGKALNEAISSEESLTHTCMTEPTGAECKAQAEAMRQAAELRQAEVAELVSESPQGSNDLPLDPNLTPGDTPSDKPAAEGEAKADGSADAKAGAEGTSASEVDGSGGMFPPGAPPWIADLFDMALTYFGIKEITTGIAMAMMMLAPEVLEELAAISAGLTKGLANEDLDKAFALIKQLYSFYNTLEGAIDNLNKLAVDGNGIALLKATGATIDALPKELQGELIGSLNEQAHATIERVVGNIGGIDPALMQAILSGGDPEAIKSAIERKAREELTSRATELIAKQLGMDPRQVEGIWDNPNVATAAASAFATAQAAKQLGVDPQLISGSIDAAMRGDLDGAGRSARAAVTREAARRTGVDPAMLDGLLRGQPDTAALRDLAITRVSQRVAAAAGVPGLTPEDIARAARGEDLEVIGDLVVKQLPPDARRALEQAADVAAGKPIEEALQDEAEIALKRRLPSEFRNIDVNDPPAEMARSVVETRSPGAIAQIEAAAKNPGEVLGAAVKARLTKDLKDYPEAAALLAGNPTARQVQEALQREAERRIKAELQTALGVSVERELDRLGTDLPLGLVARLRQLPSNPDDLDTYFKQTADMVLQDARARVEATLDRAAMGIDAAHRLASCVDPGSLVGMSVSEGGGATAGDELGKSLAGLPDALLTNPESVATEAISNACQKDKVDAECAAKACEAISQKIQASSRELTRYVAVAGDGYVSLDQAAVVQSLLTSQPDIAKQLDSARLLVAAASGDETLGAIVGRVIHDQLGVAPTAQSLVDRLAGDRLPFSPAAIEAALSGRFGTLGQEALVHALGPDGALLSPDPSQRARAVRERLERPPWSVPGLTNEMVQACLGGKQDCLAGPVRDGALSTWRDMVQAIAGEMATSLTQVTARILSDHSEACLAELGLGIFDPLPPPIVVSEADMRRLLAGTVPPVVDTIARRVVCCSEDGCSRDQLVAGLAAPVRQEVTSRLHRGGAHALAPVIKRTGLPDRDIVAKAADVAGVELAQGFCKDKEQVLSQELEALCAAPDAAMTALALVDVALSEATAQPRRAPDLALSALSEHASTAFLRVKKIEQCVREQDTLSNEWCANREVWSAKPSADERDEEIGRTCAARLKACKEAIGEVALGEIAK